jgi:putative transposase
MTELWGRGQGVVRENLVTALPHERATACGALLDLMETPMSSLVALFRTAFLTRANLALEKAAFRQQLTIYQRDQKRPRLLALDRMFWILLRRLWSGRERALIVVRPETVIGWHRQGFRLFWRRRSRGPLVGRPRIPCEHRTFIRRISGDHPEWGEDKIAEELAAKFGIHHTGSTVRRYMTARRPPRARQTWHTFINNHAMQVWACDFLSQHTAFFSVAYVFVIMEVGSRRVVHANVTTNPTLAWVKQQVREATAWDQDPRFLVHDNDGIFGQFGAPVKVQRDRKSRSYRCHLDRWLHDAMGITGLPIPYGAPNAPPHIERFMRTLREEALDHFIFLSTDHVRRVASEFTCYYNEARPSQAIHRIPDRYPELTAGPPAAGQQLALPVLGGLIHDYRLVA